MKEYLYGSFLGNFIIMTTSITLGCFKGEGLVKKQYPLKKIGLLFEFPVFSDSQLYFGLSKSGCNNKVKIIIDGKTNIVENVDFHVVFQ